ncbi:hypothetical protein B5P43_17480 [Bacillus sp. SRB_336]|nr:hypothetical protein B5P43_17480 [Bacillus sp. SRB_336]
MTDSDGDGEGDGGLLSGRLAAVEAPAVGVPGGAGAGASRPVTRSMDGTHAASADAAGSKAPPKTSRPVKTPAAATANVFRRAVAVSTLEFLIMRNFRNCRQRPVRTTAPH